MRVTQALTGHSYGLTKLKNLKGKVGGKTKLSAGIPILGHTSTLSSAAIAP